MDEHPRFPIVVLREGEKVGRCEVEWPKEGKGLPDGIALRPGFVMHRCKEHCVWVFWR